MSTSFSRLRQAWLIMVVIRIAFIRLNLAFYIKSNNDVILIRIRPQYALPRTITAVVLYVESLLSVNIILSNEIDTRSFPIQSPRSLTWPRLFYETPRQGHRENF